MTRKHPQEDEVVDAQGAPEAPEAQESKLEQGSVPRLTLTPELVAIIHANRAGRAVNSDLAALWSALYEAAGPAPQPVPRTYGK